MSWVDSVHHCRIGVTAAVRAPVLRILPAESLPRGIGVYLPWGCNVGVQVVQEGGADLLICEAIVWGRESGGCALPADPRYHERGP